MTPNQTSVPGHQFLSDAETAQDQLGFDIQRTARRLWDGKWIVVAGIVVGCCLALLAAQQITPHYRASGKVMFDPHERNVIDAEAVLSRNMARTIPLQNEIEILNSTLLLAQVITDLSLDQDPEFNPDLRSDRTSVLERVLNPALAAPRTGPNDPFASDIDFDVISAVRRNLTLRPIGGSNVIEVSFVAAKPELAADVVNALSQHYVQDQLDAKLKATRAATTWLASRVKALQVSVETAENAVEVERAKAAEIAGQAPDLTRQKLHALTSSLAVLQTKTAESKARSERLSEAYENGADLGAIHEFRASREVQLLRARQADLELEITALLQTLRPDHQAIQTRRAQLRNIERKIQIEASRIVQAAKTTFEAQQSQLNSLEAKYRSLDENAQSQAEAAVSIRQLEREANASRTLYESFCLV